MFDDENKLDDGGFFGSRPDVEPRKAAFRILEAVRGESIEAAIAASCELIYFDWLNHGNVQDVLDRWGSSDGQTDPLRLVSRKGARDIAEAIRRNVQHGRDEHHAVFEELLAVRSIRLARAGLSFSSSSQISNLMATIVGRGERVLDPACGFGGSLSAVADKRERLVVAGVDISAEAATFAMRRLSLAGVDAEIEVADWLAAEHKPIWDAIVAEPPMGMKLPPPTSTAVSTGQSPRPSMTDGDTIWLQSVVDSLSPIGRGVVLLPSSFASRRGRVGESRAQLLRSGRVEAIISIPAGALAYSGIATSMWVVSGAIDAAKRSRVLLVNGASPVSGKDKVPSDLASALGQICNQWLDHGQAPDVDGWLARVVDLETLLNDGDASPLRHLGVPPNEVKPRTAAPGRLLAELRLSSFKSVDNVAAITLRPLTLIYGKNSAGKSTLIQSLLLLKQSLAGPTLNVNGPLMNLGSYSSLVHNHEEERNIGIGVTFASGAEIDSSSVLPDPRRMRSIDFSFGAANSGRDGIVLRTDIALGEHRLSWRRSSDGSSTYVMPVEEVGEMVALAYEADSVYPPRRPSDQQRSRVMRELIRAGFESVAFDSQGLLPGPVSLQMLADIGQRTTGTSRSGLVEGALRTSATLFGAVGDELRHVLDRVVYLGPLRHAPERISLRDQTGSGLDIPFFLLDNTSEREEVSKRLQRLGVRYELDAVTVSDPNDRNLFGDMAALVLTDTRTKIQMSTADVGFGISQVLPIVTELSARSKSVILIEQPEIHLHPAMQADLADLLIESVDENGRANQVIAETHSENLMLRIQRRIREGVLDSSSVAVLYVDQSEDGSALIRELRLDNEGDFIDNWPHGFFVERFDELFGDFA
ncbi:DUF3696 domain-containing protein [Herbiconiux sp. CPCC 203407]|uniref:DUF3696 domain-containing protein n=1 Tax=Herbiconiux oxytropis TaxID=2970915 RepID=A0AA41XHS4_9MICO|nr:DUF3696 domain-containing protein [Herbiconiux oxytropis]MCS5723467.1 DUF3696 domain-containing protein [Herbiconiux oxytropis]MCS5726554.1 DUF3696 domain-containing protein [Herbiconiux oxytropis]